MRGAVIRAAAAALVVWAWSEAAAAEPLVILASSEWKEVESISLRDLRSVYLGRRTRLGGARIRRIDLPPGSAARAGFSESVLARPEPELERYWIEQALSGGAIPPRQVTTPREVVRAVRRVGTLGYVPQGSLADLDLEGVRMLPIVVDGRTLAAGDPGYPARSRD